MMHQYLLFVEQPMIPSQSNKCLKKKKRQKNRISRETFKTVFGFFFNLIETLNLISNENRFSVVDVDGENTTVAIVCTSGSTGLPKGEGYIHISSKKKNTKSHFHSLDLRCLPIACGHHGSNC